MSGNTSYKVVRDDGWRKGSTELMSAGDLEELHEKIGRKIGADG
jgi:hypothetical protein